jgi:hypothetical protein
MVFRKRKKEEFPGVGRSYPWELLPQICDVSGAYLPGSPKNLWSI